MSNEENEEEIVFKIYKSAYGERYYIKRLIKDCSGKYASLAVKRFLCKDGSIIDELISHHRQDTNYFTKKQDAIDTINEFYSVTEIINE